MALAAACEATWLPAGSGSPENCLRVTGSDACARRPGTPPQCCSARGSTEFAVIERWRHQARFPVVRRCAVRADNGSGRDSGSGGLPVSRRHPWPLTTRRSAMAGPGRSGGAGGPFGSGVADFAFRVVLSRLAVSRIVTPRAIERDAIEPVPRSDFRSESLTRTATPVRSVGAWAGAQPPTPS